MADRILIQCPGCSAKLAISDESKLGKKIRCSKCSEVFVAKALNSVGSGSSKSKPKKSNEDDLNFDDIEQEDSAESENDESAEEPRRTRSKSGAKKGAEGKGKRKSPGGNLPVIIGGVVVIVLLLGIGGYFLSGRGAAAPEPPNQQVAQQSGSALPATQPNASAAGTPSTVPVPAAQLTPAQKLGETAEALATNSAEWPAGTKGLSARTRWFSRGFAIDTSGQRKDAIELTVDVQGEYLAKTCAFGMAEIKTLNVTPDQPLAVFRSFSQSWNDPLVHYVSYDHFGPRGGINQHPEGGLRVAIPFVASKDPATKLAVVEGQFKIRTGQLVDEVVIPDLRAVANQPLEQASLKAAEAMLWLRSGNTVVGTSEGIEFRIGPNYAVGPLVAKVEASQFGDNVVLRPDYEVDVNGRHFSTRHMLRLPVGTLKMTFKLYSNIEEVTVPFRFENVLLPSLDKKPKN